MSRGVRAEYDKVAEKCSTLEKQMRDLERELDRKSNEATRLGADVSLSLLRERDAQRLVSELEEKLRAVGGSEKEISTLRSQLEDKEEKFKALQSLVGNQERERMSLQLREGDKERDLALVKISLDERERENESLRLRLSEKEASLQMLLANFEREKSQGRIEDMETNAKEEMISRLLAQVRQLEGELASMESQLLSKTREENQIMIHRTNSDDLEKERKEKAVLEARLLSLQAQLTVTFDSHSFSSLNKEASIPDFRSKT